MPSLKLIIWNSPAPSQSCSFVVVVWLHRRRRQNCLRAFFPCLAPPTTTPSRTDAVFAPSIVADADALHRVALAIAVHVMLLSPMLRLGKNWRQAVPSPLFQWQLASRAAFGICRITHRDRFTFLLSLYIGEEDLRGVIIAL